MSYPAEGLESTYRNHIEDIRGLLDARHGKHYAIYNVSERRYSSSKFEVKVMERGWSAKKAPALASLFSLCQSMYTWMKQHEDNVCVIHCLVRSLHLIRALRNLIFPFFSIGLLAAVFCQGYSGKSEYPSVLSCMILIKLSISHNFVYLL